MLIPRVALCWVALWQAPNVFFTTKIILQEFGNCRKTVAYYRSGTVRTNLDFVHLPMQHLLLQRDLYNKVKLGVMSKQSIARLK